MSENALPLCWRCQHIYWRSPLMICDVGGLCGLWAMYGRKKRDSVVAISATTGGEGVTAGRYEGDFNKGGKKHGLGVYMWGDKSRYEGEWRNGEKEPYGVYTWPDGSRYAGEWLQGRKHGFGVAIHPDGRHLEGKWMEGNYVGFKDGNLPVAKEQEDVMAGLTQQSFRAAEVAFLTARKALLRSPSFGDFSMDYTDDKIEWCRESRVPTIEEIDLDILRKKPPPGKFPAPPPMVNVPERLLPEGKWPHPPNPLNEVMELLEYVDSEGEGTYDSDISVEKEQNADPETDSDEDPPVADP